MGVHDEVCCTGTLHDRQQQHCLPCMQCSSPSRAYVLWRGSQTSITTCGNMEMHDQLDLAAQPQLAWTCLLADMSSWP